MDEYFMNLAFKMALKALKYDEIPVGAVLVKNNKVVSLAYNKRQRKNNVLGHAEILAIIKAQKKLKDWRLYNCDLYVTLKPCKMCEAIIKEARLKNIYYLVEKTEQKNNYKHTIISKFEKNSDEKIKNYQQLLSDFFDSKR